MRPMHKPIRFTTAAVVMFVVGLSAGCSDSSENAATSSSAKLDSQTACSRFDDITTDFTLTDADSAREFHALARKTRRSDLAAAIEDVANAFEQHDAAISSDPVHALC